MDVSPSGAYADDGALGQDPTNLGAIFRRDDRTQRLVLVVDSLFAVAALALAAVMLARALATGAWGSFWFSSVVALLACVFLIAQAFGGSPPNPSPLLWSLRRAAAAGDAEIVPLAAQQPAALSPDELVAGPRRLRGVYRLDDPARSKMTLVQSLVASAVLWLY